MYCTIASTKSKSFQFTMTPVQAEFRDFWNQLTGNLRNALPHHAMRPVALEQVPNSVKKVQEFWNRLKTDGLKVKGRITLRPLGARLLISPQVWRPCVLFSALKVADPDLCLVICSDISIHVSKIKRFFQTYRIFMSLPALCLDCYYLLTLINISRINFL